MSTPLCRLVETLADRSDELYVGTERSMHKVRTLRRRGSTERVVSGAVPSQKGSRAQLEAEIAKSDDGRVRLTTACLRGLARD